LKIAVNTRLLLKNKLEGIGWFTFETLKRIVHQHPEVEFYFLFDRTPDPSFLFGKNVAPVVIGPPARHPFLFVLWFEWSVPRALKRIRPDLFLSPDGYLSLSAKVPSLAVIHDLNFEHFPEDLPWLVRWYYRSFFPRFARKAKRIATVSEFSSDDISSTYGIDPKVIDVVYNGANEKFLPVSEQVAAATRGEFAEGKPYFVFVGSLHPRKNLARLFAAFDLFKQRTGGEEKLLVVGEKKWWTPEIRKAYKGSINRTDIIFSGRLEPEVLCRVTASALASVYVSYFEGFGIPIVEAFQSGVPVITADATATAEIAGGAAMLVDPFDVKSIAEALMALATQPDLRRELVDKGFERAEAFTWQKSSDRLWSSVLKALEP